MAITYTTNKTVHQGVNTRVPEYRLVEVDGTAGDVADNGSVSIVIPELIGKTGMAKLIKAWTYGGGSPGARTATALPIVDTGSALVGIEETTFIETTGVLTVVNRSGGALTALKLLIAVFPDVSPS